MLLVMCVCLARLPDFRVQSSSVPHFVVDGGRRLTDKDGDLKKGRVSIESSETKPHTQKYRKLLDGCKAGRTKLITVKDFCFGGGPMYRNEPASLLNPGQEVFVLTTRYKKDLNPLPRDDGEGGAPPGVVRTMGFPLRRDEMR